MRIMTTAALLASLSMPLMAKEVTKVRNFQNPDELVTTAPEASLEAKREAEGKKDFEFPKFGGTYSPKKFFRPKITIQQKDLLFTFGGTFREEFLYANNPILLNDSVPDGYDFFKQTLDLLLTGNTVVRPLATMPSNCSWMFVKKASGVMLVRL